MSSILNFLKLASDQTRLRIMNLLESESLSVAELQEVLQMGQSRISSQLALLKKGGLVRDKRVGKNSIYSSCLEPSLATILKTGVAALPESSQDQQTLDYILMKRRDQSRAYFDKLAGKFGKNYVPGRSWKSLAEGLLKMTDYGVVADLGAGEGTLSQLLAQTSQHVIAVDHSEKMVEYGASLAREHGFQNLEFRLGDLETPPIEPHSVDLVVFSQALHHANDPARALRSAHQILKPGGGLLVLDLLQHKVEQVKALYGDLWQGFAEQELVQMAGEAQFTTVVTTIVDKEPEPPHFQTLLLTAKA